MEPLAFCNLSLIAVICWVSYLGFRSQAFQERFVFWPEAILSQRNFYRLVTCGFLHADGRHLLFNMVSLYLFGSQIEFVFGPIQFLIIFFAAILGGSLLSLLLHRHHNYRSYGASGGVCGVIFANIFLFPGGHISAFFVPIGIPSWLYAVGFVLFSFWKIKTGKDNIGHDAHLGGALIGLFTTVAMYPWVVQASPKLFTTLTVGMILMFLYLFKNPHFLPISEVEWIRKPRFSRSPAVPSALKVDSILEKVSQKGIHSLTPEEQKFLNETSEKMRRRATSRKPDSELIL